ncbi:hypothetical protein M1555_03020 [Patescibacteria group bacterium]|nr:hypothetical protein [Patescibacteria group bacterium]
MGLDREGRKVFEWIYMETLSLAPMGGSGTVVSGIKGYVSRLLGRERKRVSPLARERESFEREVKAQFVKLKEKGLGISVFTL